MSDELKINLDDYSEEELKAAITEKHKVDTFKKRPVFEQFMIVAKQNGISITAVIALLTGGVWQKDNILRAINPPTEIINEQIIAHNLPAAVEFNSRKIDALTQALNDVEVQLNDLAYYTKKKSYSRHNNLLKKSNY